MTLDKRERLEALVCDSSPYAFAGVEPFCPLCSRAPVLSNDKLGPARGRRERRAGARSAYGCVWRGSDGIGW